MSKWMSIGYDPEHMDPGTEPSTQAVTPRRTRDDADPWRAGDPDQASSTEVGALRGLNDYSSGHWIAGAITRLVTRHRKPDVPERRL